RTAPVPCPVGDDLLGPQTALLSVPSAERLCTRRATGDDDDAILPGEEPVEGRTEEAVVIEAQGARYQDTVLRHGRFHRSGLSSRGRVGPQRVHWGTHDGPCRTRM